MSTDHEPVISPRHRLAQTRSEIQDLILPAPRPPTPAEARRIALAEAQARADARAAMRAPVRSQPVAHGYDPVAAQSAFHHAGPGAAGSPPTRKPAGARPPPPASGWQSLARRGASVWWRHHPAHAALEVADSMLAHVARRKPWQMVAVAAGVGALAMLVRPWRLVSLTGLAFAALKMTDVRSLFGALRGN